MDIIDRRPADHRCATLALLLAAVLAPPAEAAPSPDPCCAALASVRNEFRRVALLADTAARGDDAAAREGLAAFASLPGLLESTASCADDEDSLVVPAIDDARQLVDVLDRSTGLLARLAPWPHYREAHTAAIRKLQDARAVLAAARRARAHADDSTAVADALGHLDAQIVVLEGQLPGLVDADPMVSARTSILVLTVVEELRKASTLLDAHARPGATQGATQAPVADVDPLAAAAAALEHVMDSAHAVAATVSIWATAATGLRQSTIVAWLDLDSVRGGRCAVR